MEYFVYCRITERLYVGEKNFAKCSILAVEFLLKVGMRQLLKNLYMYLTKLLKVGNNHVRNCHSFCKNFAEVPLGKETRLVA